MALPMVAKRTAAVLGNKELSPEGINFHRAW
jgi:hypothetical protein